MSNEGGDVPFKAKRLVTEGAQTTREHTWYGMAIVRLDLMQCGRHLLYQLCDCFISLKCFAIPDQRGRLAIEMRKVGQSRFGVVGAVVKSSEAVCCSCSNLYAEYASIRCMRDHAEVYTLVACEWYGECGGHDGGGSSATRCDRGKARFTRGALQSSIHQLPSP